MKTLIYGSGAIGSLYAYLLHKAGKDVTILARNKHFEFIKKNGIVLVNEFTGEKVSAQINVVDRLERDDFYDLVIVIIRKDMIKPILPILSENKRIKNILFLGNNTAGFDSYLEYLEKEKILFGFGRAGGGRINHIVHYVDREKKNGKRMNLVFGEIDGTTKERTIQIEELFESSGIPVEYVQDIDGWLKYHMALVLPMCTVLLKNECDNYKLAKSPDDILLYLKAFKELGNILKKLGYKRQPFKLNLFYWMPGFFFIKIFQQILKTKFAEIGFGMHAKAAVNEFREHDKDFINLADKADLKTPVMNKLRAYLNAEYASKLGTVYPTGTLYHSGTLYPLGISAYFITLKLYKEI